MGVDIQIANKIDNNIAFQRLTKKELTNKKSEEVVPNKKINKQNSYICAPAPEYLFDEKSRKLFYSILFPNALISFICSIVIDDGRPFINF